MITPCLVECCLSAHDVLSDYCLITVTGLPSGAIRCCTGWSARNVLPDYNNFRSAQIALQQEFFASTFSASQIHIICLYLFSSNSNMSAFACDMRLCVMV